MNPQSKIRCLLINPKFSAFSFWHYTKACETIGAKSPSPPLGLLTVAALLPQNWEFRLVDLNTRSLCEEDWQWGELVCTGGMLPQQSGILDIIYEAKKRSIKVIVGGPDPSSQPKLYSQADVLFIGEAEDTIPEWINDWCLNNEKSTYHEKSKPDVTISPVPRYDLLNIKDYNQLSLQYSRGCPFNCEFCDIIVLYGRKPRQKTPEQICLELTAIHKTGYTGSIDIVDDNFIGNKRNIKRVLLPALIEWNKLNKYPFYYNTEASMNLADDEPLLELMQKADFRFIFMGIETPDPELLLKTQKSQNTVRPIVERVRKLYGYGMIPTAGFILGFDGEKKGMDKSMIQLIEDCGINMAMVGLLVALPNTQLSKRLLKEKRLLSFNGELIDNEENMFVGANAKKSSFEVIDQTVAGLNFITSRPRNEILAEYKNTVASIYSPKKYFDRILKISRWLTIKSKHRPSLFELRRNIRGFFNVSRYYLKSKELRFFYIRNIFFILWRGPLIFEQSMRLTGIYIHFRAQVDYIVRSLEKNSVEQLSFGKDVNFIVDNASSPPANTTTPRLTINS